MMYLCVVNPEGEIVLHRNLKTEPESLKRALGPYLPDVVLGAECTFSWYWLADYCRQEKIPFVLGHALYMRAIHGGKTKNDKIDSEKIARMLRGGMFPLAYAYPKEMRATRDLLRRRCYFVRRRGELLAHLQNTFSQYNVGDGGVVGAKVTAPPASSRGPPARPPRLPRRSLTFVPRREGDGSPGVKPGASARGRRVYRGGPSPSCLGGKVTAPPASSRGPLARPPRLPRRSLTFLPRREGDGSPGVKPGASGEAAAFTAAVPHLRA
jgi:hypothetical protein